MMGLSQEGAGGSPSKDPTAKLTPLRGDVAGRTFKAQLSPVFLGA